MRDVCVLMSTYNGSRYLVEQIKSILEQDYKDRIILFIRDDGSSDDTVSIIRAIDCPNKREIHLMDSEGNLGVQCSFLTLIESAPTADYYFLSDQDDVWKADHVSSAVNLLSINNPALYCSNYSLTDSNLNIITSCEIEAPPQFTPLKSLFYNQVPGCCMAWNSQLHRYIVQMHPSNVMMHDSYVLAFACFVGCVLYDPESHILHRIHGNNVIGAGHKKISPIHWVIDKANLLIHKEDYDVSVMANEFLRVGRKICHSEFEPDIELLAIYKTSLHFTFQLLRHSDTRGKLFDRTVMSIRSKILFHLF